MKQEGLNIYSTYIVSKCLLSFHFTNALACILPTILLVIFYRIDIQYDYVVHKHMFNSNNNSIKISRLIYFTIFSSDPGDSNHFYTCAQSQGLRFLHLFCHQQKERKTGIILESRIAVHSIFVSSQSG